MSKLLYLIVITSLMSCSSTSEKKLMFINSYTVDCVGVGPMQCLQIKYAESDNWTYFYDRIEGFEFEQGYLYKIEVLVDKIEAEVLPADKSNLKYTLSRVISKDIDSRMRLNDIWAVSKIDNLVVNKQSKQVPRLEFSLKKMQVLGTDGCNNIRGAIKRLTKTTIEFGPMMGTKKLCPQMDIPNAFNKAITKINTYKLEGRNLICYDKDGEAVLQCLKID